MAWLRGNWPAGRAPFSGAHRHPSYSHTDSGAGRTFTGSSGGIPLEPGDAHGRLDRPPLAGAWPPQPPRWHHGLVIKRKGLMSPPRSSRWDSLAGWLMFGHENGARGSSALAWLRGNWPAGRAPFSGAHRHPSYSHTDSGAGRTFTGSSGGIPLELGDAPRRLSLPPRAGVRTHLRSHSSDKARATPEGFLRWVL